jgi:hypothetical protein
MAKAPMPPKGKKMTMKEFENSSYDKKKDKEELKKINEKKEAGKKK